jgi:hypothetical protein
MFLTMNASSHAARSACLMGRASVTPTRQFCSLPSAPFHPLPGPTRHMLASNTTPPRSLSWHASAITFATLELNSRQLRLYASTPCPTIISGGVIERRPNNAYKRLLPSPVRGAELVNGAPAVTRRLNSTIRRPPSFRKLCKWPTPNDTDWS